MGSLNKTTLLYFFLVIYIVCVVCPTAKQIKKCKKELWSEFQNKHPLDDFLHAFLHIKYHTVYWNERTNKNDHIYIGSDVLKLSAGGYLNDLYTIAQEMGLPEILSPQHYCSTKHGSLENDCLSVLDAIGCKANFTGPDCFEKMYFNWTKTNEFTDCLPGSELISNEELLQAIYEGSEEFCDLSDEALFESFSTRSDILEELSDENLLQKYYRQYYIENHRFWIGYSNAPDDTYPIRYDDFYGSQVFQAYVRIVGLSHLDSNELREVFDARSLTKARIDRYGIPKLSYEDVFNEYKRRKSLPMFYDNLYAEDICEKMKGSHWDNSNFISREDFCVKYLSELEAYGYDDNDSSSS